MCPSFEKPNRAGASARNVTTAPMGRLSESAMSWWPGARMWSAIAPSEQDDGAVTVEQDATFAVPAHRT
jgi:hypothetical protein